MRASHPEDRLQPVPPPPDDRSSSTGNSHRPAVSLRLIQLPMCPCAGGPAKGVAGSAWSPQPTAHLPGHNLRQLPGFNW